MQEQQKSASRVRRIKRIEVFGIKIIRNYTESFSEPLIVDDLSCAKKLDRISDVGIIREEKDIIIGHAGFLLRGKILVNIRYRVPGGIDRRRGKRNSGCRLRINPRSMVDEISIKPGGNDVVRRHIFRKLIKNSGNHFHMS